MNVEPCKGRGRLMVFMIGSKGGRMPVDRDSLHLTDDEIAELPDDARQPADSISHFKTCPKANHFSRNRRKAGSRANSGLIR